MESSLRDGQEHEESEEDEMLDNILKMKIKEDLHQRKKDYKEVCKFGKRISKNDLNMWRLRRRREDRSKHALNTVKNCGRSPLSPYSRATCKTCTCSDCEKVTGKMLKLITNEHSNHHWLYKIRIYNAKNEMLDNNKNGLGRSHSSNGPKEGCQTNEEMQCNLFRERHVTFSQTESSQPTYFTQGLISRCSLGNSPLSHRK